MRLYRRFLAARCHLVVDDYFAPGAPDKEATTRSQLAALEQQQIVESLGCTVGARGSVGSTSVWGHVLGLTMLECSRDVIWAVGRSIANESQRRTICPTTANSALGDRRTVLVVTETDAADARQPSGPDATISASSSEIAQMIAASPDLLERVTAIVAVRVPASIGSSVFVGGVSNGQCSAETKRILTGATLLLMKTSSCDVAGWSEIEGLRRLGGCAPDDAASVSRGWFRRIDFDEHGERLARAYRFNGADSSCSRPSDVQAGVGRTRVNVGRGAVERSPGRRKGDVGSLCSIRRDAATAAASCFTRQYSAFRRWPLFSLGKPRVFLIDPCRSAEINLDGAEKSFDAAAA